MTEAVIDSSIALTWCFEDEAPAETDALFERVRDEGALVPGLCRFELAMFSFRPKGAAGSAPAMLSRDSISSRNCISVDRETADRAWRDPAGWRRPCVGNEAQAWRGALNPLASGRTGCLTSLGTAAGQFAIEG